MSSTLSHPKKSPSSKARPETERYREPRGTPKRGGEQLVRRSPANAGRRRIPASRRPHATTLQRREFRAWRASLPAGLERDTLLMPDAIADSVCGEVARFLGVELPDRYVVWLAAKAERCYAGHRHFHKQMNRRGNLGRDQLYAYMRHWLASLLHLERPDLYYCLPENFGLGRRLPSGTHPRVRRNGFTDLLPGTRTWDAARVLRHPRWRWASAVSPLCWGGLAAPERNGSIAQTL